MGKSTALTGYALLLPALVALAIFRIYPIATTIWGSLCTESFEQAGASVFAGVSNYADLFTDPVFWGSIWVTIKLNLVINPLQIALALGLALMANQRFPGIGFYRLLFILPLWWALASSLRPLASVHKCLRIRDLCKELVFGDQAPRQANSLFVQLVRAQSITPPVPGETISLNTFRRLVGKRLSRTSRRSKHT